MSGVLPKFDNPPVIETVLGVQFKPLVGWQTQHIGLYGSRIRSNFPEIQVHPPLPDSKELFGDHADGQQSIRFSFSPLMIPRAWFIGRHGWLVQVQDSKFFSNWRKEHGGGKYPEYKAFKEHFSKEYARFCDFLRHEKVGIPEIEQVEVSYINHIVDYDSWNDVFPVWSRRKRGFLPDAYAIEIREVFPIDTDKGRLYLRAEPVIRHTDGKEVIQFTLTAKVLVASKDDQEISNHLRLAHDWVVKGFADYTTEEMHAKWMRRQ